MNPDFTFVMHHVGARGGTCGFALPPAFHADALNVLYEPDTDCLGAMERYSATTSARTIILPYALGEKEERRAFNFHLNPFASSFRAINPRFADYSEFAQGNDYLLKDSTRPIRQEEMEVRTIDGLARGNERVPPPDFLLVDTEGSDYDVLDGARESLRSRVLAVSVESQLLPIWRDQRLFGEVCTLLDSLGFDLASIRLHNAFSPHRSPMGLRGRGFQTACDALFLRRVESLDAAPNRDTRWIMTRKLAFAALLLGFIEYGRKAMAAANALGPSAELRTAAGSMSYMRFLDRVEQAVAGMPAQFPRSFGELADSFGVPGNLSGESIPPGFKGRVKSALLKHPGLLAAVRAVRVPLLRFAARARIGAIRLWRSMTQPRHTAFERVLLDYGLADVAALVRSRRLADEPFAV